MLLLHLFVLYLIEKYLNFALEIVKICGLVFSNNEKYEKVLKSEQNMRYLSTHDQSLPFTVDTQAAEIITDRIKQLIEVHNCSGQETHLKVNFSIGYAVGEKPGDTIEMMLKNANELMFIDKANKRAVNT